MDIARSEIMKLKIIYAVVIPVANCVYKLSTCDVTSGNPWDLGLGSAPAERVDQGEVIGFSTGLK